MQRRTLEKKEEMGKEGRQEERPRRDGGRQPGVVGGGGRAGEEINSFVDLLLPLE